MRNDPTGEKRKYIFCVVNLTEGLQGEVTQQQHQAEGAADSAGHSSSSPPVLGREQCQTLPALSSANPFLTSALLST